MKWLLAILLTPAAFFAAAAMDVLPLDGVWDFAFREGESLDAAKAVSHRPAKWQFRDVSI